MSHAFILGDASSAFCRLPIPNKFGIATPLTHREIASLPMVARNDLGYFVIARSPVFRDDEAIYT